MGERLTIYIQFLAAHKMYLSPLIFVVFNVFIYGGIRVEIEVGLVSACRCSDPGNSLMRLFKSGDESSLSFFPVANY